MTVKLENRLLFLGLAAVLGATASAKGPFVEIKGVREFQGEMIVKPLTASEFEAAGLSPAMARQRMIQSSLKLEPLILEQHTDTGEYVIRVPANTNENGFAADLMKSGLYKYAEPNWILYPTRKPNDPRYAQQWHHPVIQSDRAWDLHTGAGVTVAICDTGVDLTHEDLRPLLLPGFNSVDEKRQVDGGDVNDINGHGTHCAGDAAAAGNNGKGLAGVGWNLRVMPVRVSNSPGGGASFDDILGGARWAIDNGAKIASCSYSGVDGEIVQTTGAYIRSKGGVLVYAAGNDNRNLSGFDHLDAIVVGASDQGDRKAGFSAFGRGVDLFAPGVAILSTTMGGGYGAASGTSMATPVVAGLLGLVSSANPSLTSRELETVIKMTCDNIGPSSTFGAGRINVFKAVQEALKRKTVATAVAPRSVTVNFGTRTSGDLASLATIDNSTYVLTSQSQAQVGTVAGLTTTYLIPNPTKVTGLTASVHSNTNSSQATGGAIFLWNWQTSRMDLVVTVPVPALQGEAKFKVSPTSLSRYMNSAGEVRLMYRALTPNTRNGGTAGAFRLTLDRVVILSESTS